MLPRAPVVYSWSAPHANGPLLLVLQHFFFLVFWSYKYPSCNPVFLGVSYKTAWPFLMSAVVAWFGRVCFCFIFYSTNERFLLLSCRASTWNTRRVYATHEFHSFNLARERDFGGG